MTEDDPETLSVAEFVEYCQIQAGLLSGKIETVSTELDDLLGEIDEEMAEIRAELETHSDNAAETVGPPSTTGPDESGVDVEAIEELEETLESKQALAEAKQARITAFQELAAEYTDLAADLQSSVDDGQAALTRVIEFEVEHDAPAYFPDRQTVAEAAAASSDDSE